MRLVEERYETSYLDELRLYAIDVPMNRTVYGEKPGFGGSLDNPGDLLHTTSQILRKPASIVHVNTGEDVSALLAASDGSYLILMLYTNGYYKDAKVDVPHTVAPLPFADMSGFPYDPETERYPDDPAHTQYLQEYNSRAE